MRKKLCTIDFETFSHLLLQLITPLLAIVCSIIVGGLVIFLAGVNPILAYHHLLYGAFGTINNFSETLVKTTPILIAGIGLSISFRSNLTNIGAEGQMIAGAISSTLAAFLIPIQLPILAILIVILCGFLGGALYGTLPGYLKAKYGTSEIISTIMMNYIAISLLAFLLDGPMKEKGGFFPQTALVPLASQLPRFIDEARVHIGIIIAMILVGAYYIFMFRLPIGFRIRMVGLNPHAAEYAGINVKKHIMIAMAISGGLAGIAGMSEIFGIHHRLYNGFSAGYGFDAVAIALLGRLHPLGVVLAALFFGSLRVGANAMQNAVQVPVPLVYIIQGVSVLFILTDTIIKDYILNYLKSRSYDKKHVETIRA